MTLAIIIITILIVMLLAFIIFKLSIPYIRKIIFNAINVACYVNTYHYMDDEWTRVEIGQERYYKSLFNDKKNNFAKDKTDFIFWILYTQFFNKLLNCIPIDINKYNNRCLSDGEERKTEQCLDKYQQNQEVEFIQYATENVIQTKKDIENVAAEANKDSEN